MSTLGQTTFIVVDTETTGKDPTECEMLEVCAKRYDGETLLHSLAMPTRPIPASASGIHHLVQSDFEGAPSIAWVKANLALRIPPSAVIVAHNAPFDRQVVAPALSEHRWIDTLRLARHFAPESDDHKNSTLWYHFGGPKITNMLHGAAADVNVTAFVFGNLLERYYAKGMADDVDALIAFIATPYIMTHPPFGKYQRSTWEALLADAGYCWWLRRKLRETGPDAFNDPEDLRWNLNYHQQQRRHRRARVPA